MQLFPISTAQLCQFDYDKDILIQIHDWDHVSTSDFIGEFTSTLRELMNLKNRYKTRFQGIL